MILVDKRVGSAELAKYLACLKAPVEVTDLQFGDFAFLGKGPGGVPVPVGIERKALRDWISSFYTGRFFATQVPGMLGPGEGYEIRYVIIEGLWREDHNTGLVTVLGYNPKTKKKGWVDLDIGGGKGIMASELEAQFMTAEHKGGVIFKHCAGKMETGKMINRLWKWWVDVGYEGHRSHLRMKTLDPDKALLVKPSLCRQIAACLPGVGWVKSGAVASHFGSVYAMVQASEQEWQTIDGIGKTMAGKIVQALTVPAAKVPSWEVPL
jgi:ERCC4-type nuclease